MSHQTKKPNSESYKDQELTVYTGELNSQIFSADAPVSQMYSFLNLVLGNLIYSEDSFDLRAGLLESYNWDFKEKCYILKLKPGTTFHNGRKATAQDLEFSIARGLLSKKGSFFKSFFENIKGRAEASQYKAYKPGLVSGLKVVDDLTLKVFLENPNPTFLHSLARPFFSLVPIEELKEDYYTWKSYPIGAGSYKVSEFNPKTKSITLELVDKNLSGPKVIHFITNKTSKSIDISLVPESEEGLETFVTDRTVFIKTILFNYNHPLAQNKAFRKLVASIIHKPAFSEKRVHYKPTDNITASHLWGKIDAIEKLKAEEIKSELQKLNIKEQIQIPIFSYKENTDYLEFKEMLEQQFKEYGLNIVAIPSDKKFFDSADDIYPFRVLSLGADVADPLTIYGLFKEGSKIEHYPKNDKTYESLYKEAARAPSLDIKAESVKNLARHFHQNYYAVPLYEVKSNILYNKSTVQGLGTQNGGMTVFLERVKLK